MADHLPPAEPELPAGTFAAWLADVEAALDGTGEADVPCDGCTACCTSSQFVHVGPDEEDALAHIPVELLFPAPGRPPGHVLLGYDERGHCPMLGDRGCSIYAHRPRTCRTYDCRVFAAGGVTITDRSKSAIAARVRRWTFAFPDEVDRVQHDAVRAAAAFLGDHGAELPDPLRPTTETQVAVTAIEAHRAFLAGAHPSVSEVAVALRRSR